MPQRLGNLKIANGIWHFQVDLTLVCPLSKGFLLKSRILEELVFCQSCSGVIVILHAFLFYGCHLLPSKTRGVTPIKNFLNLLLLCLIIIERYSFIFQIFPRISQNLICTHYLWFLVKKMSHPLVWKLIYFLLGCTQCIQVCLALLAGWLLAEEGTGPIWFRA